MSALDHPPAGAMWEAPHPLEKVNAELRAELAAAREELAALRRDSERYRFLRARTEHNWSVSMDAPRGGVFQYIGNDLDSAIDAAIQESRDHG